MSELEKAEQALLDWQEARCRLLKAKPNASRSDKRKFQRKIDDINENKLPNIKEVIRKLRKGKIARSPIASISYWIVNLPKCGRELRKYGSNSFVSTNDALELLNLKRPQDLTEAELKDLMKAREKASNAEKQAMMDRERAWFEHYYGTNPVQFDDTGKMVQPQPVRPMPKQPSPIKTIEGQDLEAAVSAVLEQLPEQKEEVDLVKGLQAGLNMMTNKQNQSPLPSAPKQVKLKEDGVAGPKTSIGLKKALVEKGTGKVSEALAMGQFKETVKKAKKEGPQNLSDELSQTFSPLLPKKKSPKDDFQVEGLALQDTLNDLGAGLKDDGIVGPKTTDAFAQIAKKTDEDDLANRFAYNMGFDF